MADKAALPEEETSKAMPPDAAPLYWIEMAPVAAVAVIALTFLGTDFANVEPSAPLSKHVMALAQNVVLNQ